MLLYEIVNTKKDMHHRLLNLRLAVLDLNVIQSSEFLPTSVRNIISIMYPFTNGSQPLEHGLYMILHEKCKQKCSTTQLPNVAHMQLQAND
jgi:hypothetical protein